MGFLEFAGIKICYHHVSMMDFQPHGYNLIMDSIMKLVIIGVRLDGWVDVRILKILEWKGGELEKWLIIRLMARKTWIRYQIISMNIKEKFKNKIKKSALFNVIYSPKKKKKNPPFLKKFFPQKKKKKKKKKV